MPKNEITWPYKSLINPKTTDPWLIAVGKFLINFGAIENMSYAWIDKLSSDKNLLKDAQKNSFKRRVGIIFKLLKDAALPPERKKEISSAWKKARTLSVIREVIAHNPLLLNEHGAIGIPDMRRTDLSTGQFSYFTLEVINQSIDEVVKVAENLRRLLPT